MKNKKTNKKYFAMVTYFMDCSSPMVIYYFKGIIKEHFADFIIDDEYMRKL